MCLNVNKLPESDLMNYPEYDYNEPFNESSTSFTPQPIDNNTFKQRNDPDKLLERLKLRLMNAYLIKEIKQVNGVDKEVEVLKFKKSTKPKANKQGIEEIISYMEKFINSHTVQGNINDLTEYRNRMQYISNDITMHFLAKRSDWGVSINDVDELISTTINLIDLFLTRTLFNEERKSYGESYKETTNREVKPEIRPSILQRVGGFLSGQKQNG